MTDTRKTINRIEDHINNLKQDILNAEGEISKIRTGERLKTGKAIASKLSAERIEQVRKHEWDKLTRTRPALGKLERPRHQRVYYASTYEGQNVYQYLNAANPDADIQEMEDIIAKYADE